MVLKKGAKLLRSVAEVTKDILTNSGVRGRTLYTYFYENVSVKDNIVIYESFGGTGMVCSPYAIFLQLLADPYYKNLKHVWVLDKFENHPLLIEEYKDFKNVIFVRHNSAKYLYYLCCAKYLINNNSFPPYFIKKKNQISVNTWHGIPLKTLGLDMPNGAEESHNVMRCFLQSDYMVSANSFLTHIYNHAYKLADIYKGKIIEEGYPRLDTLFRFTREQVIDKLKKYGVAIDASKEIILYAPTWKGKTWREVDAGVEQYFEFKEKLENLIDTSRYQILIKVHKLVYEKAKDKLTGGTFIPATIDANEALSIADILVGDYSSIFFDYLALRRPILFYIPDLEEYKAERGVYMGLEVFPGPQYMTIEELADGVNHVQQVFKEYENKYDAMAKWSNAVNDGKIASRVIDVVFENNNRDYKIYQQNSNKKHIFIHHGPMQMNGISSALLSLLNAFDYDRYDVTVMVMKPVNDGERDLINQINKNVRVIVRKSTLDLTLGEQVYNKYLNKCGFSKRYYKMYQREYRRFYNDLDFDYVISYDGYNKFYALLSIQNPKAKTAIWQHNDMRGEYEMKYPYLLELFKIYKFFDVVVSCSKEIMEVNKKNLAEFCDGSRFRYARNCLDKEELTEKLNQEKDMVYVDGDRKMILMKDLSPGTDTEYKSLPVFTSSDRKGNNFYRFITVGRMSPEKNHLALIKAFSRLHKENENTVLYIVGDGKMRNETESLVETLHLKDSVILTGNINNPIALMKNCDCFILPSLHEGQPVTVNEARFLKMPIILGNFSSVAGSMLENGQLIVETDEEGIYEGLKSFIEGKVPCSYAFDINRFNEEAYKEFLQAIGE